MAEEVKEEMIIIVDSPEKIKYLTEITSKLAIKTVYKGKKLDIKKLK